MTKIRSLFVNPSREEWALAIAKYFFPPERAGSMIRIDVNKSILEKIARENEWMISDPILSICDVLPSGNNLQREIFYSPFRNINSNSQGFNDYISSIITNSDDLDSQYYGFPRGIVEFSLAMVVANEHFSNANEFSKKFNSLLGYSGDNSMFSDPRISSSLRKFLASLESWCKSNQMALEFRIPDFPDPSIKWGGWGYIGRFYDHLEVTQEDKRVFLKWINWTLEFNPDIDLEDLQYDRRDLLERSLSHFHQSLSPRLNDWYKSRIKELRTKFWDIVNAYLFHLITLRNNKSVRNKSQDSFEIFELTQIKEKKNKVRPMITVEYSDDWGKINYEKLNYYLEDIPNNSLCSIPGIQDNIKLPLTDILAVKALEKKYILVDDVELIQNKTGIYPICVLFNEDLTLKSRFMLDDSDSSVSKDTEYHLLCFGSKALADGLEIARRLSYSNNLQYNKDFLFLSNTSPSITQIPYDDHSFYTVHRKSIFVIPNLIRNGKDANTNDPRELLFSSSEKELIGIRHQRNKPIFHKFAGHPKLKINPRAGYHIDGKNQIISIDSSQKYRISQKVTTNQGVAQDLDMEYEYRDLYMNEILGNNSDSFSLKQIIDKNNIMIENPDSNILDDYFDLTTSTDKIIKKRAEEHSGKVFLNDNHSLSELINSESSYPENSKNRELWMSRVKSAVEDSSLDVISQIIPNLNSNFLEENPNIISNTVKDKFDLGEFPSSLEGLHILNVDKKYGDYSRDRFGEYIDNLGRNHPDDFFQKLESELNRFSETPPIEIMDIITKLYTKKTEELKDKISKFRVMDSLNNPDAKKEAAILIGDFLIENKPYKINEESVLIEAFEIIESYPEQIDSTIMKKNFEWLNAYTSIKDSIINFDLRLLQSTPDLTESPGTVWVYLSRKIIYSWFTSWNDGDKAEDFRNNLLIRINRLPMNSDVRDKIIKIFREVTYSLMFRKKIIDDSSGGVP